MESNRKCMDKLRRQSSFGSDGDGIYDNRLDQAIKMYIGMVDENNKKTMTELWNQLRANVNDSRQETYRYWDSQWTEFTQNVEMGSADSKDIKDILHRILVNVMDMRQGTGDDAHNEDEEKEAVDRSTNRETSGGGDGMEMESSIDMT